MKKLLPFLLLLLATSCHAQWNDYYGLTYTIANDDTGTVNALTIYMGRNTAGARTWILPALNGSPGQVLTTTGANPDSLYWSTVSGGSGDTNFVQYNPTAYSPHQLIVTGADFVALALEHGSAGDTTDLFQTLDPSGNIMLAIGDEGEIKLTATQNAGANGDLFTSQGPGLVPTWTHPSALSVEYADSVLNSTLTNIKSLVSGTYNDYTPTFNNFSYTNNGANAVFTGIVPNRTNGYFLSFTTSAGSVNQIVLQNENSGSKQKDRIITGTGADLSVTAAQSVLLVYDSFYDASESPDTLGRWIVAAVNPPNDDSRYVATGPGTTGRNLIKPIADIPALRVQNYNAASSAYLQTWEYDNGSSISTKASMDNQGNLIANSLTLTTPLSLANGGTGSWSAGDAGKVLTSNGASAPTFQAPANVSTIANSIYINGIGRTPTLALLLADTTAATSSLPSFGPYLDLRGQMYNSSNQEGDVRIYDSTSTASNSVKTLQSFVVEGRTNSGTYNNFLTYQQNSGGNGDNLYVGNTNNSGLSLKFDVGGNAAGIFGGTSSAYPGGFTLTSGIGSTTRGGGGFGFYSAHTGVAGQAKLLSIDLKSVATNATDSATFTFGSAFFPEIVYTPTTISAVNAGITVPFGTVISVNHGTETGSFPITIPAGTAGQQLTIQNNTSYPTGGTVIDPGATQSFVYQNSAWQLLGQNPLFRELKITATINAAAAPTTTTTLYTMPTTGFTYFEPVFVILRVVSVSGGPTAGTLQIGSAPAPTSILGTTTEPVTSVGNCTLSLSSLSGGNVAPITPGTAIISTIATSAAPGTLIIAADIWGIYVP